jgi:low affinity Fe/Cu permease
MQECMIQWVNMLVNGYASFVWIAGSLVDWSDGWEDRLLNEPKL